LQVDICNEVDRSDNPDPNPDTDRTPLLIAPGGLESWEWC
jgi:hypothetical protein